jgi:alpha-L-fucosidase
MKMHTKIKSWLAAALFLAMTVLSACSKGEAVKPIFPDDHSERLEWWKDARFGMFIHWGPVSLKGTEIGWSRGREIPVSEYDSLYLRFNPEKFNADAWVSLAAEAGMKYIVFTSKHHDGFCNWDTRYSDYNIMHTPFHRDVMKELAEACRKQGIALGFYHSTCDWYHPDFPLTSPGGSVKRETSNIDRYTEYLKNQSVEILRNYGPLLVMWYDVPQCFDSVRGQGVIDRIREVDPGILVNNRTAAPGDFNTPEQQIGRFQHLRPWETCMTLCRQWAWKPDDPLKSLEQCLHGLIRSAGGDGNFLFNVGPSPDGEIEPLQAVRLKEMGEWLRKYGHTIYGTRGGPYKPTDWGVSTRKGNRIYLHLLRWDMDEVKLTLPDIGLKIRSCRLIDGGEAKLTPLETGYTVEFSAKELKPMNTIIELETDGSVMDVTPVDGIAAALSFQKPLSVSSNTKGKWIDVQWMSPEAVNNGEWVGAYWTPDAADENPWVEIDLGKPERVSQAVVYEREDAVKTFEIQLWIGNRWETVHRGTTIGKKIVVTFPPTTASKVRLTLNTYDGLPGIYEIVVM